MTSEHFEIGTRVLFIDPRSPDCYHLAGTVFYRGKSSAVDSDVIGIDWDGGGMGYWLSFYFQEHP